MTRRRTPPIAVIATACRFPEAATPTQLWDNVLAGRRAFRPLPASRLDLSDYTPERVGEADAITPVLAALLTDWEFDRARYRVPQSSFVAADLAHWLALDTAQDAIDSCGGADGLPRERTAVIIGNTLTGEFSRTAQLRLRFPYLRRQLESVFADHGLDAEARQQLLTAFGARLATDLPAPSEDTLAGGLANTIAGRIANHFDLHGGAWTVDGACASSLLALNDACTRLADGTIDAAIVGGVDLSLDPFELVGFSRNGALARDEMRVFDRRAAGFWPGEGCGIVVLARESVCERLGCGPLARVAGWGVSTDGAGGLTRPTAEGQLKALRQAYHRAEISPSDLGYVEAHGTGTAMGDPTEIRALSTLLADQTTSQAPVPVGSIKANIGHTKAAAGIAGFIKTVCAVHDGQVPPHVSCEEPHPVFAETGDRLCPASDQAWSDSASPRVAGVSGFGFGGVNAHVVLTSDGLAAPALPATPHQGVELFVFGAQDADGLRDQLASLREVAPTLSLAQLTDAAADAAQRCPAQATHRAALVAARPAELTAKLDTLLASLDSAEAELTQVAGVGLSRVERTPRVGLLFPGQAAPVRPGGGAWHQRFAATRRSLGTLETPASDADLRNTAIAQPHITAASLCAIELLDRLGIEADVAVGHSLGELAALHWAGALSADQLLALSTVRGRVMATQAIAGGGMVRVAMDEARARALAPSNGLQLACVNGPRETVLAGPAEPLKAFTKTQLDAGVDAGLLKVSHAFHTDAMAPAATAFESELTEFDLQLPNKTVWSTVRGRALSPQDDLRQLLVDQFVQPVRFTEALSASKVDLFIEVGSGAGLSRLAGLCGHRAFTLDAFSSSLRPMAEGLCSAWLAGVPFNPRALFDDRRVRPFHVAEQPSLLRNPCGVPESTLAAPTGDDALAIPLQAAAAPSEEPVAEHADPDDILGQVLAQVATELALPREAVSKELRFLDDLHLNSLAVGRIIDAVARRLDIQAPAASTDFANATLAELAEHLVEVKDLPVEAAPVDRFDGVAPWVANYAFAWVPTTVPVMGTPIAWIDDDQPFPPTNGSTPPADTPAGLLRTVEDWPGLGLKDPTASLRALWQRVRHAAERGARQLALVHRGAPISAFARSLVYEGVFERVVVLDMVDRVDPALARDLLTRVADGYSEYRLTRTGELEQPVFRELAEDVANTASALAPKDLLLVTGGARGIGAECAFHLAQAFGVRLALLGRSDQQHPDVAATLARAEAEGIDARYYAVDVTNREALRDTVAQVRRDQGEVSALLHAAGINQPMRFAEVSDQELERTLSVKCHGLSTLLKTLPMSHLRLAIGFGSIIGRLGHAGETHYALANQTQSALLERFAAEHRNVRVLALEWSVWGGVGMGERLGTLERLASQGVDALPLDKALHALEACVASNARGTRVITARFGPPPGVQLAQDRQLPMHRFLETVRVHYPGLELVADTRLSRGSDPYLDDHVIDGETVMPGVMLLEAMTAVASALRDGEPPEAIRDVQFLRSVVLAPRADVTLRVAALRTAKGVIECVVRSANDGFASIVCRAQLLFSPGQATAAPTRITFDRPTQAPQAAAPFYGPLFFNAGRFQRLDSYTRLSAFELSASFSAPSEENAQWFGGYQPQTLLLGDPAVRDAGLHALQAGVPQRRVIPIRVDRIHLLNAQALRVSMDAKEVSANADEFVFDIVWRDAQERIVERWEGARFRSIAPRSAAALPDAVMVPWLEREIALHVERTDIRVAHCRGDDRAPRRREVAHQLDMDTLQHRGDGKPLAPMAADGPRPHVSVSHCEDETLLVAADSGIGLDLETLTAQDEDGARDAALWCAQEALRKCGVLAPAVRSPARQVGSTDLFREVLHIEGFDVLIRRWREDRVLALALDARPTTHQPRTHQTMHNDGAYHPPEVASAPSHDDRETVS